MKVEKHLLNDLKPLKGDQKIMDILDVMEELKFSHLPVVDEEKNYLGVVGEDDLLEASEDDFLKNHLRLLKPFSIAVEADMFAAIRIIGEGNLSLLPVVDESGLYKGYIASTELLQDVGRELTFKEPGGVIVLSVPTRDYQLAQIAQIVESEDAKIVGFHLSEDADAEKLLVSIKINQVDLDRIIKSFERYNYRIMEVFHKSLFDDSMADRYQSFMKYLNI